MLLSRFVMGMLSAGTLALVTGLVFGQDYPSKPIRIYTNEAGSNNDVIARLMSPGLTRALGQPVITENRGGAIIYAEIVAKSPPDGYNLLLSGGNFLMQPFFGPVPYAVADFAPITSVSDQPLALVVHPQLPVKTVKELIALAKAKPGQLNFASTGTGGNSHLATELFCSMAGIKMTHIPYKGGGSARNDVMSGEVQLMMPPVATVIPLVKSGRLRVLGVARAQASALLPGVPTISASGVPGFEAGDTQSMYVPAKTPRAVINRLNQEINRFLITTEAKERFLSMGVETAGSSPEELATWINVNMTRAGKLIKDLGLGAK